MESATPYQINLEVFQGPLDLLLFLIRKRKIDIHDIPIATITGDYLEYLNRKDSINLEREAEFLLMASLLIYIKSQMLLPRESLPEEEDDPRKILVEKLLDYQKIKAASNLLRQKEQTRLPEWQRSFLPPLPKTEDLELTEVSLFGLAEAFYFLMKKRERRDLKTIERKEYSIEEKTREILEVLRVHAFLDFTAFFESQETLEEAVVSFFCFLELIKARKIVAVQEALFHPIKVWLRKESADEYSGQNHH